MAIRLRDEVASALASSFPSSFGDLDELESLEKQYHVPNGLTLTESKVLSHAKEVAEAPARVANDVVTIPRADAIRVSKACLNAAMSFKNALADERVSGQEMVDLNSKVAECVAAFSAVQQNSAIAFTGHVGEKLAVEGMKAAEACSTFSANVASDPMEVAVMGGHCMKTIGKEVQDITPAKIEVASMGSLPPLLLALLPQEKFQSLSRGEQDFECLRRRRCIQRGSDFLGWTAPRGSQSTHQDGPTRSAGAMAHTFARML
eukprot:TRINITY_DN20952_c0_g3_i1.p1 TRINITY_DN20952_c0_g3~~TRINITY_DN20952_c0_g3_i1.p1  ORF type:complete len:261 (-),score=46.38 TRINITY_DN20952_c0_g3_i1:97-879(-)